MAYTQFIDSTNPIAKDELLVQYTKLAPVFETRQFIKDNPNLYLRVGDVLVDPDNANKFPEIKHAEAFIDLEPEGQMHLEGRGRVAYTRLLIDELIHKELLKQFPKIGEFQFSDALFYDIKLEDDPIFDENGEVTGFDINAYFDGLADRINKEVKANIFTSAKSVVEITGQNASGNLDHPEHGQEGLIANYMFSVAESAGFVQRDIVVMITVKSSRKPEVIEKGNLSDERTVDLKVFG